MSWLFGLGISMSWFFSLGILMSWLFVLRKNALESRCRGLLVSVTRCRGFLVLEYRCRGFLSFKKTPWNHDVVAYLSPLLDVVVFWSWNLDVVVFWSWNLDVVYMCLHGLVFVIIVKTKKSRIIMSIMLLKNISVVCIGELE